MRIVTASIVRCVTGEFAAIEDTVPAINRWQVGFGADPDDAMRELTWRYWMYAHETVSVEERKCDTSKL